MAHIQFWTKEGGFWFMAVATMYYPQMLEVASSGKFVWKKASPFTAYERSNLQSAGFSLTRNTAHWKKAFRSVPKDCQSFVNGKTNDIPARYNAAQKLWLTAQRSIQSDASIATSVEDILTKVSR